MLPGSLHINSLHKHNPTDHILFQGIPKLPTATYIKHTYHHPSSELHVSHRLINVPTIQKPFSSRASFLRNFSPANSYPRRVSEITLDNIHSKLRSYPPLGRYTSVPTRSPDRTLSRQLQQAFVPDESI